LIKTKKDKKEAELVKAFLYSPIDTDNKFPCHCGKEFKVFHSGMGFGKGDAVAKCENGHFLLIGFMLSNKEPSFSDSIEAVRVPEGGLIDSARKPENQGLTAGLIRYVLKSSSTKGEDRQ